MKTLRDLPRTLPELVELTTDQLAAVSAGDGCSSGSTTVTNDYQAQVCKPDACNDAIGLHNQI